MEHVVKLKNDKQKKYMHWFFWDDFKNKPNVIELTWLMFSLLTWDGDSQLSSSWLFPSNAVSVDC